MKKIISFLLSFVFAVGFSFSCFAEYDTKTVCEEILSNFGDVLANDDGDWWAVGMRGLELDVDYKAFGEKLKDEITRKYTENGGLDRVKSTEWHKAILALIAAEENPSDINDINLVNDGIFFRENLAKQGFNAYLWALIALNATGLDSPENAINNADSIIDEILEKQLDDGGFTLMGKAADTDITALAITALSPYSDYRSDVKNSVERAVSALSQIQNDDGSFSTLGNPTSESTVQVLLALSSTGIDIKTDNRFIKNGKTVLDGLLLFRLEDGTFCHTLDIKKTNPISCEQAFYALSALWRMENGLSPLFSFSSYEIDKKETAEEPNSSEEVLDESEEKNVFTENPKSKPSFSLSHIIAISLSIFAIIFFVVFLLKKRKDFLIISIICIVLGGASFFIRFSTANDFYDTSSLVAEKTVTISISCEKSLSSLPENLKDFIPSDGIILDKKSIGINDGDSVFDVLLNAVKIEKIQMEYNGTGLSGNTYIMGISNLYEYDCGELSGWMYRVNGEFPSVSCGGFSVNEGDFIEFVYTLDLGRDVGEDFSQAESNTD